MELFTKVLVSWTPMIILIGVWIFYMKKLRMPQGKQIDYLKRQNELMEKFVEKTERIAVSLEAISKRYSDKQ
jgi:ATP-dependent Zn protease